MYDCYKEHEYLSVSNQLNSSDIEVFNKYVDRNKHQNLTNIEVSRGLFTLSSLLSTHFDKRCYILVDEYDNAINKSYLELSER